MTELPLAPLKRILKEAGATRISDEAVIELANVLEEYGAEIGSEASKYVNHAGRKTVRAEDIQMVIR